MNHSWVHIGAAVGGQWAHIRQYKHHRWSLDEDQIYQYHLGLVYMKTGDLDLAKAALTKAVALNPNFDGNAAARQARKPFIVFASTLKPSTTR